jgi:hypothetical protein
VIAAPSAPVSLTRKLLLPARGVDEFEEYSSVAAPTPGGGGANDPRLSESIRKIC